MIIAAIFRFAGYSMMESLYLYLYSDSTTCTQDLCWANNAVYRISLGLTLYFTFAAAVSYRWKTPSVILSLPFIIAAFCVPISWISSYPSVSLYFSLLFLILQVVVFLDFAHRWNEEWRDSGKAVGLLISSIVI